MRHANKWSWTLGWVAVAAAVGAVLASETPWDATRGYIAAPPGSQTLSVEIPPISMHLYSDAHFKGAEAAVSGVDTTIQPGELNELPHGLPDQLSSVRWNLPAGVIVVFYEDAVGKGEQLVLWGKGEAPETSVWDFNDKASRWAWFDVGGGPGTSRSESARIGPRGGKPLSEVIPGDCIQMFKNQDFRSDMHQVSPLTALTAGALEKIPGSMDDSLTALRWNLPEGVVVTLYEDADGKKDRVSVWGKGQVSDLQIWDFNDKVSRWSWAYIGAPATTR